MTLFRYNFVFDYYPNPIYTVWKKIYFLMMLQTQIFVVEKNPNRISNILFKPEPNLTI